MLFIPPIRLLDGAAERHDRVAQLADGLARVEEEIDRAEADLLAADDRGPGIDAVEQVDRRGDRSEQPGRRHQAGCRPRGCGSR